VSYSLSRGGEALYPVDTWRMSADGVRPPHVTNPVAFWVPGAQPGASDEVAGFRAPPAVQRLGALSRGYLVTEAGGPSELHTAPAPPVILGEGTIPIHRVAAMSSAAGGFAASTTTLLITLRTLLFPPKTAGPVGGAADVAGTTADLQSAVERLHGVLSGGLAARTDELSDLVPPSAAPPDEAPTTKCQEVLAQCESMIGKTDNSWFDLLRCAVGLVGDCGPAATAYLADLAPCATAVPDQPDWNARACPFPTPRLIDGGFVDNLATAQTLGQLQAMSPPGTRLRAILVDNLDTPDPAAPGRHGDVANLFTDGGQWFGGGLSAPSSTVFAARFDDLALRHVQGTTYVNYYEVATTTVANEVYGVAAGSPVDVLVLCLDGPIGLTIGVTTSEMDLSLLGTYAADAATAPVQALVQDWLARTA